MLWISCPAVQWGSFIWTWVFRLSPLKSVRRISHISITPLSFPWKTITNSCAKPAVIYLEDEAKWDGLGITTWEQNPFRIFSLDSFLVLSGIFCNPLHLSFSHTIFKGKKNTPFIYFSLAGKKGFPLHTVSQGVYIASEQVIYQNKMSLSSLPVPKLEQGKNHNFVPSLQLLTLWHPQIPHNQPKSGYLHSVVSRAGQPPCSISPKQKTGQNSGPKVWKRFRFLNL